MEKISSERKKEIILLSVSLVVLLAYVLDNNIFNIDRGFDKIHTYLDSNKKNKK